MGSFKKYISRTIASVTGAMNANFNSFVLQIKKILIDRNALIFIAFLALSTLFWFLKALSKPYETELKYPVKYSNFPKEYMIENTLPDKLMITVHDRGFALLRYKLTSSFIPLGLNIENLILQKNNSKQSGYAFIEPTLLLNRIRKQLSSGTELLAISPDTVYIHYSKLRTKKVPVVSNVNITPEKQYIVSGRIIIKPDSVTIFGPRNIIDTMSMVLTENDAFKNIDDTLTRNIALQNYPSVEMDKHRVLITVPIEPFTEKRMMVPVIGRSFPDTLRLRTFPGMVEVAFFVGLSKYNEIQPEDVKVYIDYNAIKNNPRGTAHLELLVNKAVINNPRLKTGDLEYLLEYINSDL